VQAPSFGAILVNGTLSRAPRRSMMRVSNVTLASGSTTYFEMTPTVSDALVITGNLAIASGTTLQIVGEQPLTPGIRYHLITATDGITGSFATIDKVATVQASSCRRPTASTCWARCNSTRAPAAR
jgi:hypothetical protein